MRTILVCLSMIAPAAAWAQAPVQRFENVGAMSAIDVLEACAPLVTKLDTGAKKPKFAPTEQDLECWRVFSDPMSAYCATNGFTPTDEAVRKLLLTWRWTVKMALEDKALMEKTNGRPPFRATIVAAMIGVDACQKKEPVKRRPS